MAHSRPLSPRRSKPPCFVELAGAVTGELRGIPLIESSVESAAEPSAQSPARRCASISSRRQTACHNPGKPRKCHCVVPIPAKNPHIRAAE